MTIFATSEANPIALPPLGHYEQMMADHGIPKGSDNPEAQAMGAPPLHQIRPTTGDVVLLSEPCPKAPTGPPYGHWQCCGEQMPGLVVAGYLTATVLPIVSWKQYRTDMSLRRPFVSISRRPPEDDVYVYRHSGDIRPINLPGAEPGGVAVTFQPIDGWLHRLPDLPAIGDPVPDDDIVWLGSAA